MENTNINKLIIEATKAYNRAYAPYSKFNVGATILDENGDIHIGCNVENAAYPSGSCAEQNAIGSMIASGGKLIKEILIIGKSDFLITPCGACRQRIREFSNENTLIHISSVLDGFQKTFTIETVLPDSFGPENL